MPFPKMYERNMFGVIDTTAVVIPMNSAEYIGLGRILNPKNFCSLLLCKVWCYFSYNHDKPELYLVCA